MANYQRLPIQKGGGDGKYCIYKLKLNEVRIVSIRIHATTTVRTLECLRACVPFGFLIGEEGTFTTSLLQLLANNRINPSV